nr:hypothetical protein FFPRI1PSEUD_52910 [Pseudomonas sp. FFPRI_1]
MVSPATLSWLSPMRVLLELTWAWLIERELMLTMMGVLMTGRYPVIDTHQGHLRVILYQPGKPADTDSAASGTQA